MGSISVKSFDFVVVGAGPAGCMVANRLARTLHRPSVVLIEAGGKNDQISSRIDGERWITRMNPAQNWGYQSTPQEHLNGHTISLDRGKGLGGSSSVNFSVWTIGPASDHDEIARLVGDDEWKWENAQKRYKRIEAYHAGPLEVPADSGEYLSPRMEDHGVAGPIKVGFPNIWEKSFKTSMDALLEAGVPRNLDHNSGNPLGIAVSVNTAYKGTRSTAADALLDAPENLTVLTETEIARIIFNGTQAAGVETTDGVSIRASKEVVLCCGALDTPRVLMHSGIGPKDQLAEYGIRMTRSNANVGQNLLDHQYVVFQYERAEHTTDRHLFYKSKELQAAARKQWMKDQTGSLAEISTIVGVSYLKNDTIVWSKEFEALPENVQKHLLQPTTPHLEFIVNGPSAQYFLDPDNTPAMETVFAIMMNSQSKGWVRLQSSDPKVPLLFNPNFLSHPFDKRVVVESTRAVLKLLNHQAFKKDTVAIIAAPESDSEEDILKYWKGPLTGSTWHMTGTAVMGKSEEEAVVDAAFKVFGVQGLRVADMSIYPIIPNNHTQTSAYLAGLMLGDKLVEEYQLEG